MAARELSQEEIDSALLRHFAARANPPVSGAPATPAAPGTAQYFADQMNSAILADGPQVVEANGTRIIFGTCNVSALARMLRCDHRTRIIS